FLQPATQQDFALVVHIAAGFIKQQYGRVVNKRATDGNGLPLATGQRFATLTYHHVVAVGMAGGKLIHPSNAGSLQHAVIADERSAQRQVLPQRAVEKNTSELQSRENLVCRLLLEK